MCAKHPHFELVSEISLALGPPTHTPPTPLIESPYAYELRY